VEIEDLERNGVAIVAPKGRIDSTTSAAFDEHLLGVVSAGSRRIVVDFAAVDYISSAGLRVMLALAKRMRENKSSLVLCGMGEAVHQVFALAGFLPLFAIDGSRDAALIRALGS
jgi:anti-anti-sigma factor